MVIRTNPSGSPFRPKQRSFRPKQRSKTRSKESEILRKSRKDLRKTQENMRVVGSRHDVQYPLKNSNAGPLEAKVVEKSISKSSHFHPISKDIKQSATLSSKGYLISHGKEKIPTLSKSGVLENSSPTHLKDLPELAHKGTKGLNEQPHSDQGKAIAIGKGSIKKLDFSKASKVLVPENNFSNERKERHDKFTSTNEKGKARPSEGNQHMQELQRNLSNNSKCHRGKEDGRSSKNFDQRDLTEINFEWSNENQVANYDGKTNNFMSKKRKEQLLDEKPKAIEDNDNKDVQGNSAYRRLVKKQRRVASKDDEEGKYDGGNHNPIDLGDEIARSLSQDDISKDGHAKVSTPTFIEQQDHYCLMPIDKPTWSGIFKIDSGEYISSVGHLSNKSCDKVWSLSRQLLPIVELKKLPRSKVWPKAWEASKPNGDHIGIYFFPRDMRQFLDKDLDQLLKEVMENDLVLRAIVGDAEMLIFPSIILPNPHKTFQTKYYLWGVFKPRENIGFVVAEPLSTIGRCAQEVENKKQQHDSDQQDDNVQWEEPDPKTVPVTSSMNHRSPAKNTEKEQARPPNMAFDINVPEEGTQQEAEATPVATDAAASPANHGQIDPSMGLPLGKLMGFVVRQTPKLEQLIREMKREGALIFAMEGESLGAGSWPGSIPAAVQK
ncbi:unnamed protein product [Urochloa decumbens]|uniref:AIPP2-like SPOC-like domain-containing protein n=1 Tax=Urochloa decumbens TaxID=240449 RepID=A0ABC8W7J5_9POAL